MSPDVTALFAQIGATELLFWMLRAAAGLGGAFVGWFVSDPLTRLLYRAIAAKPTPQWILPWTKLLGAGVVGLLVFYLIPLGGSGGLGFGPGQGGSPGAGPGKGGDGAPEVAKGDADAKKPAPEDKQDDVPVKTALREPVEIELLGGDRYRGDQRYYLVQRREPARLLAEVKAHLDERHGKTPLEVRIFLTRKSQSVGPNHPAFQRLENLVKTYGDHDAQERIPITVIPELNLKPGEPAAEKAGG